MTKKLIVIVGPTAIGKTSAAISIAKHFETEIISSDSRQFFKEMRIGTAVPSQEELAAVPHHFVQHISIHHPYSVGDFEKEAIAFIHDFFKRKNILVMAGGSGLYEKAVTKGLDKFPEIPQAVREELNKEWQEKGLTYLQQELKERDNDYFSVADIENPHRIIRALEVIRHTKKPFSFYLNQEKDKRDFEVIKIGLQLPRAQIYERINLRVEQMMEQGLLKEVVELEPYRDVNALNTVGYKEIFAYLDNKHSLEEAVAEIQKNTRRFAKRQLTWYRKDQSITWFSPLDKDVIIKYLEGEI